jgi:hypothetical protein
MLEAPRERLDAQQRHRGEDEVVDGLLVEPASVVQTRQKPGKGVTLIDGECRPRSSAARRSPLLGSRSRTAPKMTVSPARQAGSLLPPSMGSGSGWPSATNSRRAATIARMLSEDIIHLDGSAWAMCWVTALRTTGLERSLNWLMIQSSYMPVSLPRSAIVSSCCRSASSRVLTAS